MRAKKGRLPHNPLPADLTARLLNAIFFVHRLKCHNSFLDITVKQILRDFLEQEIVLKEQELLEEGLIEAESNCKWGVASDGTRFEWRQNHSKYKLTQRGLSRVGMGHTCLYKDHQEVT